MKLLKLTIYTFLLSLIISISSVQAADPRWEDSFNDCPVQDLGTFAGFSCDAAESICGVDTSGSTDVAQCYDRSLMSYPTASTTSATQYTAGEDGGYVIDCYADMDAGTPYCDNSGDWWCNMDSSCDNKNVFTVCDENDTSFSCGDCYAGYQECDGSISDADGCEVRTDISGCNAIDGGNNINNRVDSGCNCDCDPGYIDCNDDDLAVYGQGASDGDINTGDCEVRVNVSACDILGGVFADQNNFVDGACGCVCDTNYLDCSNEDGDANTGTGNCELRINWDNANHVRNIDCVTTACEADYLDCDSGFGDGSDGDCEIHDGSACVTSYGEPGTIMGCSAGGGNCVADVVNFQTGTEAKYATSTPLLWGTQYGTGPLMKLLSQSASTTGGVFFVENDGRVGVGTSTGMGANDLLTVGMATGSQFIINKSGVVTAGVWEGGVIGVDFGGTGTSTWTANSIVYASSDNHLDGLAIGGEGQVLSIVGGSPNWSDVSGVAHPLLGNQHTDTEGALPVRGDLIVASSTGDWDKLTLGANGYILYSNGSDAVWDSFAGLFAGELAATTTDALAEGSMNHYYHTSLFEEDLLSTTSLPHILSLAGLSEVGTVATGTWQADLIDVAYGGTGWNSSGESGFALLTGGVWSASSTISSSSLDPIVMIENENISLFNNDASYITLLSLSSTADGITYNNTNGEFSLTENYEIPLSASTSNWNSAYNNVNLNNLNWSSAYGWGNHADFGYFSTSTDLVLSVQYGGTGTSTEFDNGAVVFAGQNGIYNQDSGNFFYDDMNNRLGLGTSTPGETLSIDGNMDITGSILPGSSSASVGTAVNRFEDGYFVNLDVTNMTIGSTSISGSISNVFTINSNNSSADLEDSSLVFSRGTINPDAQVLWDSSEDFFMFNFPIGLDNLGALRFYESDVNGSNYAELRASSTLSSNLSWILPTTAGSNGDSLMLDAAGNMVWENSGEIISGTIGQIPYYASAGNILSATSSIYLSIDSAVGIGTTSPLAKLDVYGNLMISGANRYINFATSSGQDGYGMRDFNGQVQVKSRNGDWAAIGAGAESLAGLNDTDVVGVNFGELLYYANSGSWEALATSSLGVALSDTTGILDINRGGTGLSSAPSYGELLIGDSGSGYTLIGTSSLGLSSEVSGQAGQIPFFNTTGVNMTATSVIYINTATGFIGMATTTPGRQLTVSGSGQFDELCFADGSCITDWTDAGGISGSGIAGQVAIWDGGNSLTASSTIQANVGGTGKSEWTPLSIPYLSGTTTFGEIGIGSSTYVLAVNATGDGYNWVSASSTGVVLSQEEVEDYVDALINDADSVHERITITYDDNDNAMDFSVDADLNNYTWDNIGITHLTPARGGTGWDSSASSGIAVINNGIWSASTTLRNDYLNANVMIEGENISLLTNNANYITLSEARAGLSADGAEGLEYDSGTGAFTIHGDYLIPLTASTTNWNSAYDMIVLNSSDWNAAYAWGNHATFGYFSTSTDQILEIQYGGTGTSTWSVNSLVYADADNSLSEVLPGSDGFILKSENGVPTWVATSSLGIDFSDVGGMLDAEQGGTGQDSSGWTGFAYIDGGNWMASNTVAAANLDSIVMVEGESLGLLSNSSTNYITLGSLDSTAAALVYNDTTGDFSIDPSYEIPLIASTSNWNTVYNLVNLSSADWNWTYDVVNASSSNWQTSYETVSANSGNWDLAYGWGNHATFGYFSTSTDQVLGIEYGGTGTTTWQTGSLVYADAPNSLTEVLAGTQGQVLLMVDGTPTWSSSSTPSQHAFLSATHHDTTADDAERGALVTGQGADARWARLSLGADGYILRSNGTDIEWSTSTNITALGTINVGRWEADVIDIAFGGTGATTATGARENLDLDEVYKFGINATGTDGYVWKSDGDGRGEWVSTSSLNIVGTSDKVSKLIGTTSVEFDGHFATTTPEGSFEGYTAANILCDYEFSGSHFCRTYDILVSAEQDDISTWAGKIWVAEGPPGFTSNSNDCQGWTSNSDTHLGAWWDLNPNGGKGWLVSCDYTRPLSCCAR